MFSQFWPLCARAVVEGAIIATIIPAHMRYIRAKSTAPQARAGEAAMAIAALLMPCRMSQARYTT